MNMGGMWELVQDGGHLSPRIQNTLCSSGGLSHVLLRLYIVLYILLGIQSLPHVTSSASHQKYVLQSIGNMVVKLNQKMPN